MSWLGDLIKWNIASDPYNDDEPDPMEFTCSICGKICEINEAEPFTLDNSNYICYDCYIRFKEEIMEGLEPDSN